LTSTCVISTASLHDALPIFDPQPVQDLLHRGGARRQGGVDAHAAEQAAVARPADARHDLGDAELLGQQGGEEVAAVVVGDGDEQDRKSTRLNSSHVKISYAV